MEAKNAVFIASSLDGYISDAQGKIDWLESIPNPDGIDMGYEDFISGKDAILMGRNTFETVIGFDIPWPYQIPVYVWSSSLKELPEELKDKVKIVRGEPEEILNQLDAEGKKERYIDGGRTIQSFLQKDLIDEMIITTIPILLGSGTPLFGKIDERLRFKCVESKRFLNAVNQVRMVRER
jgi:dihydrofolate reductase